MNYYAIITHFVLVWRSTKTKKKTHDRCQWLLIKAGLRRCIFSIQSHAMDSWIAVVCVVLAVIAVDQTVGAPQKNAAAAASGPAYTTKYDNIDIDQILASKRLVNSYVQCLLEKKPCTPEGGELKSMYTYNTEFV